MRGSEAYHTKFLKDVLGGAVPPCCKIELNEIVKKENFSWRKRALQIKKLIIQCVKEDPNLVPALQTEDRVERWVKQCIEEYDQKLKEHFGENV